MEKIEKSISFLQQIFSFIFLQESIHIYKFIFVKCVSLEFAFRNFEYSVFECEISF